MVSHLYPESYPPFSSPNFSQSNATGISLIKLLTLSTDSVTKNNYCLCSLFQAQSSPLKFCDRVCTQSKKLYEAYPGIVTSGKMWAGKWCITFWVTMKRHGEISTYFRLKHHCGKEVRHFSMQCIQTKTM